MLYPQKVAAVWLRSGVPLFEPNPNRIQINTHTLPDDALLIPIMCNLGTKEGVTVKTGRFSGVWASNELFFNKLRRSGGLVGISIDPLSSHECGNSRYLAIPWLDTCLSARLPLKKGSKLRSMPTGHSWLAPILGKKAVPEKKYQEDPHEISVQVHS